MAGDNRDLVAGTSSADEVDAFLRRVAATAPARPAGGRGRLMFAMDATASRQPTWDRAIQIQGEMFEATSALGGLDVQLVFYRGFRECRSSPWLSGGPDLTRRMGVRLGVLAVPQAAASVCVRAMAAAGISGVWSFVPVPPADTAGLVIEHVDLAQSLAVLSHRLINSRPPPPRTS